MYSNEILGKKYYLIFNKTYQHCGHNYLINTLFHVCIGNGKKSMRVHVFVNLERQKTITKLVKNLFILFSL